MFEIIREKLFGKRNPYGQYAGLVAMSMIASRAAFNSYTLSSETLTIDVRSATLDQLVAAYKDCRDCLGQEYPETEEGCGRALDLMAEINEAIIERFPDRGRLNG